MPQEFKEFAVAGNVVDSVAGVISSGTLGSFHPETPDEKQLVSDLESGDFLFWQGNQGIVRRRTSVRRTSKTAD